MSALRDALPSLMALSLAIHLLSIIALWRIRHYLGSLIAALEESIHLAALADPDQDPPAEMIRRIADELREMSDPHTSGEGS